jgi:ATP-dependent Clp protease ATP-binding subunit ClpC
MKDKALEALKGHFRPEFLNRVDEVIVFGELTRDEVTEIVDLFIDRLRVQLMSQGVGLDLTKEAKYFIAEKGYDPSLGARPLRREIQRRIENPLSEKILNKEFHAGETVLVDVVDKIGEDGNPVAGEKDVTFKGMPTIAHEEDKVSPGAEAPSTESSVSGISSAVKPKPAVDGGATAPAE